MKTTIKEGSDSNEATQKEIVNIQIQGVALINNPERKLRNYFKRYKIGITIEGAILLLFLIMGIAWKFDVIVIIGIIVVGTYIALILKWYASVKKILRDRANDEHAKTITLDESGISVDKDGAAAISLLWDNISFVRSFEHTICFFSKDRIILPINKAYKKKIQENLRENKIKIKAIGDLDF